MPTHTSIATRLRELEQAQSAAERKAAAPYIKERESLKELCGGLGHGPQESWTSMTTKPVRTFEQKRCSVCGVVVSEHELPKAAPQPFGVSSDHIEVYQW